MIDTDKYKGHREGPWDVREAGINRIMVYTDDEGFAYEEANRNLVADAPLILEAYKRLREENETLRKMDWEYECLWTWLAENTNLLNTIEPLMEEWKKEMIE